MCLGIPGQVVAMIDETLQIAKVDVSGVKRAVSVALLASEGIKPGDWVLIHVGFAMSKIDEHEAQETMRLLQEMGSVYTDELNMLHQSRIGDEEDDETNDERREHTSTDRCTL